MQSLTEKINGLKFTKSVKAICQAYQEISVMRMQKSRSAVLNIRYFLDSLTSVYRDVKSQKPTDNIEDGLIKKKNHLAVIIAENTPLYGNLIINIYEKFQTYINNEDCDLLIIGKQALNLYQSYNNKRPITYFDLPENEATIEDIKHIVYFIIQYEKVRLFYGRFQSVLTQDVVSTLLTGNEEKLDGTNSNDYFVYEPSYEEIKNFFETQVFAALFKQSLTEAELARHASRIKMMEEALVRINEKEMSYKRLIRRYTKKKFDNRQMNLMTAVYRNIN